MCLRLCLINSQCALCGGLCFWTSFLARCIRIFRENCVIFCQSHVSEGVVRIFFDGLLEIYFRFGQTVGSAFVPVIATFEVKLVCLGIGRTAVAEFRFLRAREVFPKTRGDFPCNLALYSE